MSAQPIPENIRCYGQPDDCRGWRQFLVERACSHDPMALQIATYSQSSKFPFPYVVWVCKHPDPEITMAAYPCPHARYLVHQNSVQAMDGNPHKNRYWLCASQGRFIE